MVIDVIREKLFLAGMCFNLVMGRYSHYFLCNIFVSIWYVNLFCSLFFFSVFNRPKWNLKTCGVKADLGVGVPHLRQPSGEGHTHIGQSGRCHLARLRKTVSCPHVSANIKQSDWVYGKSKALWVAVCYITETSKHIQKTKGTKWHVNNNKHSCVNCHSPSGCSRSLCLLSLKQTLEAHHGVTL